jgi:hypothetical protein
MKSILALLLVIASATCFGQASDADVKALVEKAISNKRTLEKRGAVTPFARVQATRDPLLQGSIQGKTVPAGVYALRDGMPCLVPDLTAIAAIPNAFGPVSVPFKTGIPNAYPPSVIPLPK